MHFSFLTFLSLSLFFFLSHLQVHGRLSVVHTSKHSPFHGADAGSEDHGRLCTDPSIIVNKTCTHVVDSLLRSSKKWGVVGMSTSADACASISEPHLSSCRCRFQTGENREKLAHISTPGSSCLETLLRNWHSCWTPWSVFRNSNDERTQKQLVFRSVTVWSLGLVVRTWKHEVRGVIFHQRAGHSAELAGATANSDGKRRCGQPHHPATENRADYEHGRRRPATGTPTPTKSSANSFSSG